MRVQSFWKKTPWRSPKYGLFVRTLPCALTGDKTTDYLAIDPHHEERAGNSGMATKAGDERQIPVRHDLHVRMESGGSSRASVYAEYGKDPEDLIIQTQGAWFHKHKTRPWEAWYGQTAVCNDTGGEEGRPLRVQLGIPAG